MRRWTVIGFFVAVVAATLARYRHDLFPPAVEAASVTRGPAVEAIYATGNLEPTIVLPLGPRATGRLIELYADEGTRVVKGTRLARFDDADLRASIRELEAREELARSESVRLSKMQMPGAMSEQQRDNARFNTEAAVAAVDRARRQLEFLTLLAEQDGEIIRRDGEIGQVINANQTVFWLSGSDERRVSSEVDEEDIPRVALGQEVLLRADAFPGVVFHGAVQSITPRGDPIARSFRVRVHLPSDTKLRIGMTTELNIIVARKESTLLVPTSAVDGDRAWQVLNGRASPVSVSLGIRGNRYSEILSGLEEGAMVVLNPPASLVAGSRVRAVTAPVAPNDGKQVS